MIRTVLIRLAFFLAPFAVFFLWRAWAGRTGRAMGSTPWTWLVASGATLAALSLALAALFPLGPHSGTYVPARVRPDGSIARGYFVPRGGEAER